MPAVPGAGMIPVAGSGLVGRMVLLEGARLLLPVCTSISNFSVRELPTENPVSPASCNIASQPMAKH